MSYKSAYQLSLAFFLILTFILALRENPAAILPGFVAGLQIIAICTGDAPRD